jgi:hypothetical protein
VTGRGRPGLRPAVVWGIWGGTGRYNLFWQETGQTGDAARRAPHLPVEQVAEVFEAMFAKEPELTAAPWAWCQLRQPAVCTALGEISPLSGIGSITHNCYYRWLFRAGEYAHVLASKIRRIFSAPKEKPAERRHDLGGEVDGMTMQQTISPTSAARSLTESVRPASSWLATIARTRRTGPAVRERSSSGGYAGRGRIGKSLHGPPGPPGRALPRPMAGARWRRWLPRKSTRQARTPPLPMLIPNRRAWVFVTMWSLCGDRQTRPDLQALQQPADRPAQSHNPATCRRRPKQLRELLWIAAGERLEQLTDEHGLAAVELFEDLGRGFNRRARGGVTCQRRLWHSRSIVRPPAHGGSLKAESRSLARPSASSFRPGRGISVALRGPRRRLGAPENRPARRQCRAYPRL